MRTLIIGFGSIGRRHLRNLLSLGEGEVVIYRTGKSSLPDFTPGTGMELAGAFFTAEDLSGTEIVKDLKTALARKPDAAIIANPTALHLDAAIPAARAGCHLLIEKPVSHSLERLDELETALTEGGGQALVGYHFRYHPGLREADSRLADQAIGKPLSFRAHWGEYLPGWHPWENYRTAYSARPDLGGGVTLTLSHPLDYVRWLFGEVDQLWAFSGSLSDLGLDVEDTIEIGLRLRSGVIGSIHLDYNQRPPRHHLEVIGGDGTLYWDGSDGKVLINQAMGDGADAPTATEEFIATPPPGTSEAERRFERNDLFLAEMRHFIEIVQGRERPACPLADGVEVLRLSLAALESANSGRLWARELPTRSVN